jgi:hypothetical protein
VTWRPLKAWLWIRKGNVETEFLGDTGHGAKLDSLHCSLLSKPKAVFEHVRLVRGCQPSGSSKASTGGD